jgi:hypothetical protein
MPDITVSNTVHSFMQAADAASARAVLGALDKAGDTMSGKLNLTSTAAAAPLNLGGNTGNTGAINGDLWMGPTGILQFRASNGVTYTLATLSTNVFAASQQITNTTGNGLTIQTNGNGSGIAVTTSTTNAAVRITQTGTGEVLRVEDSANPDTTAFVVDAAGRVGVGVTPDATAALAVDSGGVKLNGVNLLAGAGSPEGVVSAPVGSFYLRSDGAPGSTFYVKESGSGNTGWAAK